MENNLVLFIVIITLWIIMYFIPIGLWFTAKLSGVKISLWSMIFMKFRKVKPATIVRALIVCKKGDLTISQQELEALFLSGRNIDNIVNGMVYAKVNNVKLNIPEAVKLDMENKDVIKEISK